MFYLFGKYTQNHTDSSHPTMFSLLRESQEITDAKMKILQMNSYVRKLFPSCSHLSPNTLTILHYF